MTEAELVAGYEVEYLQLRTEMHEDHEGALRVLRCLHANLLAQMQPEAQRKERRSLIAARAREAMAKPWQPGA